MNELRSKVAGAVVCSGETGYEEMSACFYPGFEERPLGVVVCANEADVFHFLQWARDSKLPFAIRSGGHSPAGYSGSSGLVIDLSRLNGIEVDGAGKTAWIGAGAKLGAVTKVLDGHDLHLPVGSCEHVGIGGFMQGGGYGYTSRMFGIHCDSVIAARVMLFDGRVVRASQDENADLFWALRGGTGGNFGVLLQVQYRLHALGDVWAFALQWDTARAPEVIAEIQDKILSGSMYPEFGFMLNLCRKGGQPLLLLQGLYVGQRSAGLELLGRFDCFSGLSLQVDRVIRYPAGVELLDCEPFAIPDFPVDWAMEDHLVFKETGYVGKHVPVAVWAQVVDAYVRGSGDLDMVVLEPYGGNIRKVPVDENAFIHRQVDFNLYGNVFVGAGEPDLPQARKWLDDAFACLQGFTNGHRYQNYPKRNFANYRWAYWGESYPVLESIKKKYDPEGLFRFEQDLYADA
ncbi:MAG TPA: FAD-binding oxidoreductase [Acidovorax sp.]|nr:FAD-binding oxidoreductase [Acidovorax sp.]